MAYRPSRRQVLAGAGASALALTADDARPARPRDRPRRGLRGQPRRGSAPAGRPRHCGRHGLQRPRRSRHRGRRRVGAAGRAGRPRLRHQAPAVDDARLAGGPAAFLLPPPARGHARPSQHLLPRRGAHRSAAGLPRLPPAAPRGAARVRGPARLRHPARECHRADLCARRHHRRHAGDRRRIWRRIRHQSWGRCGRRSLALSPISQSSVRHPHSLAPLLRQPRR